MCALMLCMRGSDAVVCVCVFECEKFVLVSSGSRVSCRAACLFELCSSSAWNF